MAETYRYSTSTSTVDKDLLISAVAACEAEEWCNTQHNTEDSNLAKSSCLLFFSCVKKNREQAENLQRTPNHGTSSCECTNDPANKSELLCCCTGTSTVQYRAVQEYSI